MKNLKPFLIALFFLFAGKAMAADDLLVYYGYLNSFNSATNAWNNDNVVTDIGTHYQIAVFGDGLEDPTHPDYANTQYILAQLKTNYPGLKVFGYVSANQALQDFQSKASQWDTLGVQGIFFDEAGYDFGKTRQELNQRLQFVKQLNYATLSFVNAWNPNHVLGTADDPSYPNTTFNPTSDQSLLDANDYYLLESFVWVQATPDYSLLKDYLDRGDLAKSLASSYPIKLASISILDNNDVSGQDKFDHIYKGAYLFRLDAIGSSDLAYAASTAKVTFWTRPNVSHL